MEAWLCAVTALLPGVIETLPLVDLALSIYFNPMGKLRQARAEKDASVSSELDCVGPSHVEASTYGSLCSLLH